MLFPTVRFAVFFAIVLPIAWMLAPRPGRPAWRWKVFLLGASWVFYAAWDWRFVPLLLLSAVGNEIAANGIHLARTQAARDRWLVGALVGNLGVLAWFKYLGFLAGSADSLLRFLGVDVSVPYPEIVLPVGISFFTFQAISYVFDVHRRRLRPTNLLDAALFLSFFPQLVAGPIVRANEFLPQLERGPDPRGVPVGWALTLIGMGLVKKVVVASHLAEEIVDPLFATPSQHGGLEALVGVYAYAIQIYADFSGYTDIAIGIALLLGFRFPRNFDRPYAARSLQEFWRRWHLTLSRWLRDYLYIPLGGSRGARKRTARNLMLTMLLGGLWHGAAWTFVIWGGLHGSGLVLERRRSERRDRPHPPSLTPRPRTTMDGRPAVEDERAVTSPGSTPGPATGVATPRPPPHPLVSWLITFHLVCLGWVFFRAPDVATAVEVLRRIVTGSSSVPLSPVVVALVATALAVQQIPEPLTARLRSWWVDRSAAVHVVAFASLIVGLDVFGPDGVAPFIYFQF